MEDKFVVKNASGNVLMLPKNRITLAIGARIDLADRLNKTIRELKRDDEIFRELTHGNLVAEEEVDTSIEAGVNDKIDRLLGILESGAASPEKQTNVNVDADMIMDLLREQISKLDLGSLVKGSVGDKKGEGINEEKMREEALRKLVDNAKIGKGKLEGFGSEREVEEDDDFSDLIDF